MSYNVNVRVVTANFSSMSTTTFPPGESVVIDFIQYFQFTWFPLVKHRRRSVSPLNPVCDSNQMRVAIFSSSATGFQLS